MAESGLNSSVSVSEVYALTDLLIGHTRKYRGNLQQEATRGLCMGVEVKKELEPYRVSQ